jgi:hypothetical protein
MEAPLYFSGVPDNSVAMIMFRAATRSLASSECGLLTLSNLEEDSLEMLSCFK